jgi:alcohol dehydrogenase class IV
MPPAAPDLGPGASTSKATEIGPFAVRGIPEIAFGRGRVRDVADDAAAIGDRDRPVVVVTDGTLLELGLARTVVGALEQAGAEVMLFAEIRGEPKQKEVDAATAFVRAAGAGLVVCLGGGSAMDVGKIAATVAVTDGAPADFAMEGRPLPRRSIPKICIPTTAGTGSEFSSTNIFANDAGRKVWVWGAVTKPERVILDPELTSSQPAALTAWTGLDAFVHALEASTNVRRHAWNDRYAHAALALIAGALEAAVRDPHDLAARSRMLLGAAYAGIALDNCSAALAHNISHALAALGPVHHGLATALALEAILGWQVAADDGAFAAAAEACGLACAGAALAEWYPDFLTRCGVERRLPPAFKGFGAADLAAEMRAPETQYMRRSTAREVSDGDIDRFAAAVMALA